MIYYYMPSNKSTIRYGSIHPIINQPAWRPDQAGNALPAALPVLPQQVEDEATDDTKPDPKIGGSQGLAALIQAKSAVALFVFGGNPRKSSLLLVWIPAWPNGWEGETSTWGMIFFLSVLFGSQMLHGPWVRPMLRWLMGYGDVQLFELFGTKTVRAN